MKDTFAQLINNHRFVVEPLVKEMNLDLDESDSEVVLVEEPNEEASVVILKDNKPSAVNLKDQKKSQEPSKDLKELLPELVELDAQLDQTVPEETIEKVNNQTAFEHYFKTQLDDQKKQAIFKQYFDAQLNPAIEQEQTSTQSPVVPIIVYPLEGLQITKEDDGYHITGPVHATHFNFYKDLLKKNKFKVGKPNAP